MSGASSGTALAICLRCRRRVGAWPPLFVFQTQCKGITCAAVVLQVLAKGDKLVDAEVAQQMAVLLKQMQVRGRRRAAPRRCRGRASPLCQPRRRCDAACACGPCVLARRRACSGCASPTPPAHRTLPCCPSALQAALPAEVFQGLLAGLKPKQQQRLQEVLSG